MVTGLETTFHKKFLTTAALGGFAGFRCLKIEFAIFRNIPRNTSLFIMVYFFQDSPQFYRARP